MKIDLTYSSDLAMHRIRIQKGKIILKKGTQHPIATMTLKNQWFYTLNNFDFALGAQKQALETNNNRFRPNLADLDQYLARYAIQSISSQFAKKFKILKISEVPGGRCRLPFHDFPPERPESGLIAVKTRYMRLKRANNTRFEVSDKDRSNIQF